MQANPLEPKQFGADRLLTAQNQALELIARDAPLSEILDFIARWVESLAGDLCCSILLLEGKRLRHGAGPSLPLEYIRAIDGVEIGPRVGSCGTAAFRGQEVVVADLASDPLWEGYRELALPHGLRACWSTPILSTDGAVLGTFAIYYPQAQGPREHDYELVATATHLATLALERNATWRALERQAAGLADANQAKDRFFATLSHELRNPLAPLLVAIEIIRLSKYEPTKVERCCAVVDRQARQLARLVDDLLDVARITRGKIELQPRRVRVRALIDAARETAVSIDEGGHEFSVELAREDLEVYADAGRMIQVLVNLLNNAAKYTDPGGRVRVRARQIGPELVVQVADTGQGIEPSRLVEVFETFAQVEGSRERARGGFGVGLSIARSLVELHGGTIEAASEGPGMGSEFTIRLPIATSEAPEPEPEPISTASKRRRRVLVVDDNEDAALLAAELLEMVGHETRVAHEGLAALAIAASPSWVPDVVVLDIGLPDIDGFEVARRLRRQHPDRPLRIIAVSGYGQAADFEASAAAGIDAHIVKPVDLATLVRETEAG